MSDVRLYHPELDRTESFPESSVPFHRAAGWEPVEDEPEPELEAPPPKAAAKTDEGPAPSGPSASEDTPRRRRTSKQDGDE